MSDKTGTEGVKLYIGGTEVTKEYLERALKEYEEKMNSPEYIKKIKESKFFDDMPQSTSPEYKEGSKDESKEGDKLSDHTSGSTFEYYRLPHPPRTVFKVDYEHYASYKFNETQKSWTEFPIFVTDLEYGNIRVEK